ncbi:hypothetical protein FZI85_25025 [Mycobacterium sp. CBMA293]|uniref:hypothetical protein n=1 Tax=unclassified Mycolicibacterium TaxID=2636767 RepID=UPI0012DF434E|nr:MULTISPECIES: hypothetical protein [unclassified Mycolicibacterium]MUL47580.1 hypothetical protein [Mycolicibacterium sp. CBMA 360]MUL61902.1 hypothetical protein [Mycolicibacterium sp. CBMA 335]MUL68975.1 hypothetical protein [Mycolicibacterium sp. CBMA 311]MUL92808.1 hypothetical protein [Mycolicibacterium sp. CBMA 230]MUM08750.1 hypothetical protein [Mycolicibacterium sp. CBMA 213]
MNASEDQTEPMGESPPVPAAPKHPNVQAVTYYKAQCTSCGKADHFEWTTADEAHNQTVRLAGWFRRAESFGLLCPDCQKCDECGGNYAGNVGGRLLCLDHDPAQAKSAPQPSLDFGATS